jgi:phosphohistidine phosphatase
MRIYLMRHAAAACADEETSVKGGGPGLSPQGLVRARAAARGLATLRIGSMALLTSPLVRAAETAEIAAQELGMPGDQIRRTETLHPASSAAQLLSELSQVEAEEALCIGHSPLLDDMISLLLGSASRITALKKTAVACIEIKSFSPPRGVLLWLHPQKVLRKLGK